jgi:hypothetical protein
VSLCCSSSHVTPPFSFLLPASFPPSLLPRKRVHVSQIHASSPTTVRTHPRPFPMEASTHAFPNPSIAAPPVRFVHGRAGPSQSRLHLPSLHLSSSLIRDWHPCISSRAHWHTSRTLISEGPLILWGLVGRPPSVASPRTKLRCFLCF